jgi:hypothetical protein
MEIYNLCSRKGIAKKDSGFLKHDTKTKTNVIFSYLETSRHNRLAIIYPVFCKAYCVHSTNQHILVHDHSL